MNTTLIVLLRSIHVFGGALWIGAAIFYLFFLKPSLQAIGPSAPQFMQTLTERRKYPIFMMTTSLLTILAGLALYLYTSGGLNPFWFKTGPGVGYTIGALAGLIAFLVGGFGLGPTSAKLGALGAQIGRSGGRPTPEQAEQLHKLDSKLIKLEQIDFIMLVISMATMATARYWTF